MIYIKYVGGYKMVILLSNIFLEKSYKKGYKKEEGLCVKIDIYVIDFFFF